MRINDYDSLVNENLKGPDRWHKCYCVATAAGVATAVGAVASAGAAVYSASQSKGGGGGAGGSALYGSKIDMPDYHNNVSIPNFNAASGTSDYLTMLPQLQRISQQVTAGGIRARNQVMPGSSQLMANASDVLTSMSHGIVPADVAAAAGRATAERNGGAVNPNNPGADQLSTDFARNIGQTSQTQINNFLTSAPNWEQLADSFAYSPNEAMGDAMNLLQQRYSYVLGAGALQKGIDENQYSADLNSARGAAMPDPAAVGSRNDMLLQQAMQGINGGNSGYLTAISGLASGIGTAAKTYGSLNNTGMNDAGFYGTQAQAVNAGGAGSSATYYGGTGQPGSSAGWYIGG